jgi:hypothetical protein
MVTLLAFAQPRGGLASQQLNNVARRDSQSAQGTRNT